MKTILLLLIQVSFINFLQSQSLDKQWYVLDKKNQGVTVGPSSNYIIQGVSHPIPTNVLSRIPRNDLFIIYDGGESYFNSRIKSTYSGGNIERYNYNLNPGSSSNDQIEYLYYTNNYERDDYPPKSIAINGNNTIDPSLPILDIAPDPSKNILSVNKSIVPNTDIVLIIDARKLGSCEYELYINEVDPGINTTFSLLDTVEVFQTQTSSNSFSYPSSLNFIRTGNFIPIKGPINSKYLFLAFKTSSRLDHDLFEKDLNFRLKKITNGNTPKCNSGTTLKVGVKKSNDPNFVRVNSICKDGVNTFVNYRIQFFNDSQDASAESLKVKDIVLPDFLDDSCIEVTDWKAGNAKMKSSNSTNYTMIPELKNNLLNFYFESIPGSNHVLPPYDPRWHDKSVGYVEFCIKVKPGVDILNFRNSLDLGTPNTWFLDDTYPIKTFHDLPCVFVSGSDLCKRSFEDEKKCVCTCGPIKKKKRCWLFNWFRKH